ncbi:MAG: hypothetical protein AB1422_05360 [bacterium]
MCNLKGLKENSRGTGIKTIMCSIAVICVLLCSSTIAQGIEWQWPWLKAKEQKTKQEKVVKKKNLQLKPKQIGTPTVQALLDKVKENYQKIQDLKADVAAKAECTPSPPLPGLYTVNMKWYFKAPDKLKMVPPNEKRRTIVKNNTKYTLHLRWGKWEIDSKPLYWYYLLDPGRFDFYWRLDEIITKFDTKVINHPEENIWVIEAVPKKSNPEDDYNYPLPRVGLEIYIDYEKGVMTKIVDFDAKTGEKDTPWCEIKDFKLISNIWVPTKFIKITESTEEITLSDIQLNIGIPDSEFEF